MISVVGRFLEHSRIFSFDRGDETLIYIGSADLMPRNLDTRVELLTPIRDESLRAELTDTLDRCFADNTNCWDLDSEGTWTRRTPGDEEPRNVQRELMAAHAALAAEATRVLGRGLLAPPPPAREVTPALDRPGTAGQQDSPGPRGRKAALDGESQRCGAAISAKRRGTARRLGEHTVGRRVKNSCFAYEFLTRRGRRALVRGEPVHRVRPGADVACLDSFRVGWSTFLSENESFVDHRSPASGDAPARARERSLGSLSGNFAERSRGVHRPSAWKDVNAKAFTQCGAPA